MTSRTQREHRIAEHHPAAHAPAAMRESAAPYRTRFDTDFASLTYFSGALLEVLQAHDGPADLPPGLRVASAHDPSVLTDMAEITRIANLRSQSAADRTAYLGALLRMYAKLPVNAAERASGDVLCVGPEREGRRLAEILGCLPAGRSITPSAKRIAHENGILVGLSEVPATTPHRECLVVDGVVASGATVMALLQALPRTIERVTLLTAQSTAAGMWAVHRYARLLGFDCELVAGHISGVLNGSFYATDDQHPDRVLLGDVGDTICGPGAPLDRETA